jgi:hypothetical protein
MIGSSGSGSTTLVATIKANANFSYFQPATFSELQYVKDVSRIYEKEIFVFLHTLQPLSRVVLCSHGAASVILPTHVFFLSSK